jgi:hypothetical protein
MADDNVASLVDKRKARAAEKTNHTGHFNRILVAQTIVANAIQTMRRAGVRQEEIAHVLIRAGNELR